MALAAVKGWYILQIDFITAYLNGDLLERIHMYQFKLLCEFMEDHPDLAQKYGYTKESLIRLMKPLYGLKQAGGPVLWQSKKQSVVAKSTPEAEYIALSEAAGEAV